MNSQQLAELLVGIAHAQAAILSAVERADPRASPAVRQAAQQLLQASLVRGTERHAITFKNLPLKLLEGALAPGSLAGRELEKTALAEISRLLT